MATPSSLAYRLRRFSIPARTDTSSIDDGSSATRRLGFRTIPRAIAIRCRCPPLSSWGYRSR